jgi:hypothetical protein
MTVTAQRPHTTSSERARPSSPKEIDQPAPQGRRTGVHLDLITSGEDEGEGEGVGVPTGAIILGAAEEQEDTGKS